MHASLALHKSKDLISNTELSFCSDIAISNDLAKYSLGTLLSGGVHTEERISRSKLTVTPDKRCPFCNMETDNPMHSRRSY